jgi:Flp pilus assembly pilin Flp
MKNAKGQNMVEYVLLVTAILLVCIYFFTARSGGPMPSAINASLNSILNQINTVNSQIQLQ